MEPFLGFLRKNAQNGLLAWAVQAEAAQSFGVSLSEVERIALENDILPLRYQRNRQMITCRQQLQLFSSVVAVIGCGGLGGYIIEELARLGVGHIIAIDPDVFDETNLNRQLFASLSAIGRAKVVVAAERVAQINPAITLDARGEAFSAIAGERLLKKAHLAVDALDNISVRLELAAACREAKIPLIHGAIAGWYGQVTTQFPGERTMESLYQGDSPGRGIEKELGNPSFTPAVIASLEVAEVCKVLLGKGEPLRGCTLAIDLREMEFVKTVSGS
jgi:molybdopterin/thiamine biosynthesis adenylyltransferase